MLRSERDLAENNLVKHSQDSKEAEGEEMTERTFGHYITLAMARSFGVMSA